MVNRVGQINNEQEQNLKNKFILKNFRYIISVFYKYNIHDGLKQFLIIAN